MKTMDYIVEQHLIRKYKNKAFFLKHYGGSYRSDFIKQTSTYTIKLLQLYKKRYGHERL